MENKRSKKALIKKLYIQDNLSYSRIMSILNINRNTIYYHKQKGICWDSLREERHYNNLTSIENFKKISKYF